MKSTSFVSTSTASTASTSTASTHRAADMWHDGGACPRKRVRGLQFHRSTARDGSTLYRVTDATAPRRRVYSYTSRREAARAYDAIAKARVDGKQGLKLTSTEERAILAWRAANAQREADGLPAVSLLDAVSHECVRLRDARHQLTFADAIWLYVDALRRRRLSKHHIDCTEHRLVALAAEFPARHQLAAIDVDAAANALEALLARNPGAAPRTQKAFVTAASGMWTYLAQAGHVDGANPWTLAARRVLRAETRRPSKERTDAASLATMLAWTQANMPSMLAALAVAAFAGLRPSEIHRLEWRRVILDKDEAAVIVAGANLKTSASARKVSLSPAAATWLAEAPREGAYVIPAADEAARAAAWTGLVRALKAHVAPVIYTDEALPAPVRREEGETSLTAGTWPRDLLRHSYGTYQLAMTGDIDSTASVMGNTPAVCRAHYAQQVRRAEAVAWFDVAPSTEA